MSKMNIFLGSIAVLGLFAVLFLITPVFSHNGYGYMMGNYNGQNIGSNGCPMFDGDERGAVNSNNTNDWGMMGNWR